ncbi:MAG TPA: hypothetical protein EYP41_08335, partial [Anaerolineae bacterium]|nr:hypothetical protein [Anaerolineae bacterium]
VTIDGQEILTNTATNGGGIFNQNGVLTATNNILAWNSVSSGGAGVYNTSPLTVTLLHQTFYSNTAAVSGGGIFSNGSLTVAIRSNIFQQNQAATGSAIRIGGGAADLDYNYYFDDLTPVSGAAVGAHSIVSDAIPPGLTDPANGNFLLRDDAPARDGGDPNGPLTRDYENDIRPSDQGPDMGADEVAGCRVRLNENNNLLFGSIQAAMAAASPGDIIDVSGNCAGTHEYDTGFAAGGECRGDNGVIFTNVHIDKNVTLRGGWNNEFTLRQTPSFLDAEGQGRVIYVAPGFSPTIDGFNILRGNVSGADDDGAGICVDNASPIITNNKIYSNTATGNGGGIFSINGNPVIDNGNRIRNNSAANGGGVYLMAAGATTATVQNNFIYENTATNGAGLYNNSGDALIWHNTLVNNAADGTGGAIYVANDSPDIRGNLVVSNTATATGGLYGATSSTSTADYNNLHANSSNYGGTISAGANDLAVDPQFTSEYLISYDSPLVEEGDPDIALDHDYEGDIRPSHQGVDIGADEVGGCYARNTQNPSVVYGSLQQAVDLAGDGDTIQVDGLCLGANTRQNNGGTNVAQNLYISKSLTIEGNSFNFDQDSPLTATLDARALGRVVYVDSGATVTLTEIILTGGDAASAGIGSQGGGVYNDGVLFLDKVTIRQNNADDGGGVYNAANLYLTGSWLWGNTAVNGAALYNNAPGTGFAQITSQNIFTTNVASGNGAAVYQNDGDLFLDGAKIHDNLAQGNGAVYLTGGAADPVDVRNVYFYRNVADRGAGVYNNNTDAAIWHNTFFNNQAIQEEGGGLYSANSLLDIRSNIFDTNVGTGVHAPGAAALDYNNVIANFPADYGGSLSAGTNDISATPLYVDPILDNFRLLDGSPGADAGDPALPTAAPNPVTADYDGDIRPTNGGPDMGADEINSCLIQVENPLTGTPTRFGVLQEAIDYAETFSATGTLPDVQIARGECRGALLRGGTHQVGYVSTDLNFIGSLRRSNFSDPDDYN